MDRSAAGLRQYYVAVGEADAKLTTLVELLQALQVDIRLALAVACSSRDSIDAVVHALNACKGFNIAVLHADLELHDMEQQILQIRRRLQRQQQAAEGAQEPPAAVQPEQAGPPPPQQDQPTQQQQGQQQQMQPPAAAVAAADRPPQVHQATAADASNGTLASTPALQDDGRSLVLVTSDVVLKNLSKDLLPLGLPLLLQYDLPATREVLQRRLAAVFGSSKERGRRSGRQVVIDFVTAGDVAAFRSRERMSSAPVMEMPVHVPDIFC